MIAFVTLGRDHKLYQVPSIFAAFPSSTVLFPFFLKDDLKYTYCIPQIARGKFICTPSTVPS